ncbi:NACHT domain-containing protein [Erwinia sp. P7711]|uniref:NACHT domain-containing protein n=1 Tax=Erwinia sp. P7711 TaxID=3141451 RepID=UPI003190C8AD
MAIDTILTGAASIAGKALINSTVKVSLDNLVSKIKSLKWRHGSDAGRKIYDEITGKDLYYLKYIEVCIEKNLSSYTLLDPENKTSISTTYYPIKIKKKTKNEKKEEEILTINDSFYISDEKITNVSGTAGQGKSTILRKILINQIEHGDKLPFFINLSAMKSDSIFTEILTFVEQVGVDCNLESLNSLFTSGRVVIFLDGFDEVQTAKREDILKEIININENLKTQIITSSRPDTIICDTSGIKQLQIENLNVNDVIGMIKRAGTQIDVSTAENALNSNPKFSSSLKTPILVILFIKCFPFMKVIPNDTIEFYKSIFDVMYETHDKIKRFSGRDKIVKSASRSFSYDMFCALCFVTLFDEMTSMTEKEIQKKAFEAMELINPETENTANYRDLSRDLITDIKNITSLLIKDSDQFYTFPHKSIQEYHAAEFIKTQPLSDGAKEKYCAIISERITTTEHMLDFIYFLGRIDKIDSINYILEPYLTKLGVKIDESTVSIDDRNLTNLIKKELSESFIVFIPRGTKSIKYKDEFITNSPGHNKKKGGMIIGPTNEILNILNSFATELRNNYADDVMHVLSTNEDTILKLMNSKEQQKIPLNAHIETLNDATKKQIMNCYRNKLTDFHTSFYIKNKKTPIKSKPSFLERYKSY